MHAISVLKFIENSIATDYNEVVLVSIYPESCHIGISDHNSLIAVKLCKFSLNVTKCATYWKSAREYPMRSQNDLALKAANLLLNIDYWGILVDSSIVGKYAVHFDFIGRFVIVAQPYDLSATVWAHAGAWISRVSNVAHIVND